MVKRLNVGYLIKHPVRHDISEAEFHRALALKSLFTRRGHRFAIIPCYSEDAGRVRRAQSRPILRLFTITKQFCTAIGHYTRGAASLDIVILAMTGPLSAAAGWWSIRRAKVPVLLHVADIPSLFEVEKAGHSFGTLLKWSWFSRIEKRMYERADHIVVVSPRFKRAISSIGIDASRISTLTNSVDLRRLESAKHRWRQGHELSTSSTGFRAIYAGNMSDMPGLDILLDVATGLRDDGIEFLMVGDGECKTDLENRARTEDLDNVTFTGGLTFERTAQLVAACDVALIPLLTGLESTIPSKFYMSLVCGTPVLGIGPTRGALAELIAKTESGVMLPREPWLIAESLRVLARFPRILDDVRNREAKWAHAFDSETVNIHFARIVEALADKRSVTSVDNLELSRSEYSCDQMDRSRYEPSSGEPASLSSFISYLSRKLPTP